MLDTNVVCPVCGKAHLVRRQAKKGKNKGMYFYACANYPKCKNVYNDCPTDQVCPSCGSILLKDSDGNLYCSKHCQEPQEANLLCPVCRKGHLVRRVATKGKNKGNVFYGCSCYPRCKTILSEEEYEKLKISSMEHPE